MRCAAAGEGGPIGTCAGAWRREAGARHLGPGGRAAAALARGGGGGGLRLGDEAREELQEGGGAPAALAGDALAPLGEPRVGDDSRSEELGARLRRGLCGL